MAVVSTACVCVAPAPLAAAAPETTYPARPVRLVVGYPAGSINDLMARFVGSKLSERWGQPMIVDNRAGANGIIGAEYVVKANPDGHTLLFTSTSHTMNPALYKLSYDPLKSFTPLTTLGNGPLVLVANAGFPATNGKALIELAKARPNSISYGIAGTGSTGHFAGALFARTAGIQLLNVPYRGGAQAMVDLVAGQVQVMFSTAALARAQLQTGKIRALGVTTAQRSTFLPGVPTLAESGAPGYEMSIWWAALGPAGMPAAVVAKLNTEIARILNEPESAKRLEGECITPWPMSGPGFSKLIAVETDKWQRVAREADIKAE